MECSVRADNIVFIATPRVPHTIAPPHIRLLVSGCSLDTLFVQRNSLNGSWPVSFCATAMENFGFDCKEVFCPYDTCCPPGNTCYIDP